MKKENGQALVEFVIILPIALLLIFCVVDFGRVISLKNDLEGVASNVVTLYENGSTLEEINSIVNKDDNDIKLGVTTNDNYVTVNVSKQIEPITPGLSYIRKDVFNVSTSRVIRND